MFTAEEIIDSLERGQWVVVTKWHMISKFTLFVKCEEGGILFRPDKKRWKWSHYQNYFIRGSRISGRLVKSGYIKDEVLRIGQLIE